MQLRKAVIASTIGTAIEWYDFFLYGTAAGLIFGKLYFPNEDALTATLAAFGTYFIGFVGRPIGAAIFGHYGDRIGRKATLIATLLCMGIATFLIAFVPTYASIGIWGAVILTVLRMLQGIGVGGEWGGSVLLAMEWSRSHGQRGLVASWPQFGVPCGLFLANLAVLAFSQLSGDQFSTWGWRIPFALSIILVGVGLWIRLGILDAGVPADAGYQENREDPDHRGLQEASEGDLPVGIAADVRASAVLHLHRVHLRLRRRYLAHVARSDPDRRAGCLLRLVRHHPAVGPHLRPHRAQEDVFDRRGDGGRIRFPVLWNGGHGGSIPGVHRNRAVAHPA
jgi:MFS family permease